MVVICVGLSPITTKPIEHVTMSIHMAPDVGSLNSYPWKVIPMQGLSNLHKPWWGCWAMTSGTCLLWYNLLGWSGLWTCHLDGGCGLWPSFTIGCQEWSPSMSSAHPAIAAFSLGGLCQSRGCDLQPIGGQDIFQNFLIGEWSQGLHHMLKLQYTSHQLVRLAWGQWLGFFLPNVGGPLHKPGSSGAVSAGSNGCWIAYPGGAGISPYLGNGVLAAQSIHYLPLMHGILPCIPERTPTPSWQIPRYHLARNLPEFSPPGWHV